jgi:hypothetical protein
VETEARRQEQEAVKQMGPICTMDL